MYVYISIEPAVANGPFPYALDMLDQPTRNVVTILTNSCFLFSILRQGRHKGALGICLFTC